MRSPRGYSLSFRSSPLIGGVAIAAVVVCASVWTVRAAPPPKSPFSDYRTERPGAAHHIVVGDLPPANAAESVDNGPNLVPRPKDAWPSAPVGFRV